MRRMRDTLISSCSHASDAWYSASKFENRNYNFGYNFVHVEARALVLVASDMAHRDELKWYIIYSESIVYPKILSFIPKIYRLSLKFILCPPICAKSHFSHLSPKFIVYLQILSSIPKKTLPWVSPLQGDFASGFASQSLPLTWATGPRWLRIFCLFL